MEVICTVKRHPQEFLPGKNAFVFLGFMEKKDLP
jgi:hypothetical protein